MGQETLSALSRELLDACSDHEAARGTKPSPTWEAVKAAANTLTDAIETPDDGGDFSVQTDGPVMN